MPPGDNGKNGGGRRGFGKHTKVGCTKRGCKESCPLPTVAQGVKAGSPPLCRKCNTPYRLPPGYVDADSRDKPKASPRSKGKSGKEEPDYCKELADVRKGLADARKTIDDMQRDRKKNDEFFRERTPKKEAAASDNNERKAGQASGQRQTSNLPRRTIKSSF